MESFLATLKEQVKCSLCNEVLNEPKLLPCFHVLCTYCIKGHLQVDEEENTIIQCPQCDSESLLQDPNDLQELQISPVHSRILRVLECIESQNICSISSSHPKALWQCLDCNESLCEECLRCHAKFTQNHQVISLSDLKEEDVEVMLKKERPCEVHDGHIVESYCKNCDMLICVLCMKSHCHKHDVTSIEESIAIEKDSLSTILEDIQEISEDEEKKKQQEDIALHIKNEGEKAEKEVKELTKKLIQTLKNNEQCLLNKIHKSIMKAKRNLRVIRHTTQAQEYIKYLMENGTASEMIITRQGESSDNFTYDPFDQSIARVEFTPNEDLREELDYGIGEVETYLKKADPMMSSVRVEPAEIQAFETAQLIINVKTSKREDTDEDLENIEITFTPDDATKGEFQMADDSEITMDFTPLVPGPLTANIALHGNSVSNSPLVMLVKPQLLEEQTGYCRLKEALNTGSKNFAGIAVNNTNSKIAVADCKSNCVRIYNLEGELLLTYGSEGKGKGQLQHPIGLAFISEIDMVIADKGNNRICIVPTEGRGLTKTIDNMMLKTSFGVDIDDESNIIVCDYNNDRIQVLSKDGERLHQFDVPRPYHAIKHNGRFYVSDHRNALIRVIEVNGNQTPVTIATIGGPNYRDGQIGKPCGVAIDNENNLLVCDCKARLIHKFTLDGRYVGRSSKLANRPVYIIVLRDGQMICTTHKGIVFFK